MYIYLCFFFNDTATTEIYTLSLHDALPIYLSLLPEWSRTSVAGQSAQCVRPTSPDLALCAVTRISSYARSVRSRSEEHTSELQSRQYLVCRLLLEKKKKIN